MKLGHRVPIPNFMEISPLISKFLPILYHKPTHFATRLWLVRHHFIKHPANSKKLFVPVEIRRGGLEADKISCCCLPQHLPFVFRNCSEYLFAFVLRVYTT